MKRFFPFLLIALVALAAVAGGALFYRAKVAELTPQAKAGTTASGSRQVHLRGNPKAKVTLKEFGDFQCPPCGILSGVLARLEHDLGDDLAVVFRNFPLEMHPHAMEAALAAEAAGEQGKFWEMHDLLFRNQIAWAKETDAKPIIESYARDLSLDLERFRKDLASPALRARIEEDKKLGDSLGVTSTPTLFINDQPLAPSHFNEPSLRAAIAAAQRGEAVPTPPPRPSVPSPVSATPPPLAPTPQP